MGSTTSRIQSDRSSRISRTKRKLSSLLLCGLNSNSHSSVLELESQSPISSIENIPPTTSVESVTSAGVASSFLGSEPVSTSSKTSESETEASENRNDTAKNPIVEHDAENYSEDKASTSNEGQPNQESVSSSSSENMTSPITAEENIEPHENQGQNGDSDGRALLVLSDSFLSLRMFGTRGLRISGNNVEGGGILVVDTHRGSSNGFNTRNGGRVFGESSWRRRSRREGDFRGLILTAGSLVDNDDLGSRDRWLLDISGNRNEERRLFRSQMSERGVDEREQQTRFCASGVHRDGTCSCGSSFLGGEVGSLGSISRVVLLAQALSEVLDEIHQQPLSLSMPMLSLPAPESVVDSFLLKSHKKMNESESGPNYVQQCYICLVDYEEGDNIRVLPCQHEYHATCVDKWLKEVNGVCPVCRCNVCDTTQGSVSSSELPA